VIWAKGEKVIWKGKNAVVIEGGRKPVIRLVGLDTKIYVNDPSKLKPR
jgi:hypothetical protein